MIPALPAPMRANRAATTETAMRHLRFQCPNEWNGRYGFGGFSTGRVASGTVLLVAR
jgi:hypothetical protein